MKNWCRIFWKKEVPINCYLKNRFKRDFNAVALSIPQVAIDRGRGDPRNILGLVIYHDLDTDLYRIAVNAGVVKESYSRNQFDCCPE